MLEERELLRIHALLKAGQTQFAQKQAELFRQRFPKSLLLRAIEQLLHSP